LMPSDPLQAVAYLAANLAFLPGLFPITPLSAVNWSLSYEWWFYATCTLLFVVFGLGNLPAKTRAALIAATAALLALATAAGIPGIPVRGISLLAGMLLAEAAGRNWRAASPLGASCLVGFVFVVTLLPQTPGWLASLLLAISFALLCSAAFFRSSWLSKALSFTPLRWLGNISYSFYLVHGFVVVTILHFLGHIPSHINLLFWIGMAPIFAAAFAFSAGLFLAVEKPFSLDVKVARPIAASPATVEPQ